MIDKTLVCMIDETLREVPQLPQNDANFGFETLAKTLEVRANQAHLLGLPIFSAVLFNARDFVRDLFTICRFASPESRKLRAA